MSTKINSIHSVTHEEILRLAIAHLNSKINEYEKRAADFPGDHPLTQIMKEAAEPLKQKRETIKKLYRIETGIEYK